MTPRMSEARFKQLKRKKLGSFDALDILEILQELDRARAAEREVPDWQGLTAEVLVLHEDV